MIIKIEDAPSIKNIKIDISFDEDGISNTITKIDSSDSPESPENPKPNKLADIDLDLDDNFDVSDVSNEVIEIPKIPDVERDISISSEMKDAEF